MYVYIVGVFFQLITVLCMCMYGLCPCACVAYDLIKVMLFFVFYTSFNVMLNNKVPVFLILA